MGIELAFRSAAWVTARRDMRPFVRHLNPEQSPAQVWRYSNNSSQPVLTVLIPTLDANRGGHLPRLLGQLDRQLFSAFELIVVRGDSRQGRAINIGAGLAGGRYLLTLDDDTSLPDPATFAKLVDVMERYPEIGVAGGNNVIPQDATPFVRRVMKELPRRSWTPVKTITDSDLAEHPCMIMRVVEFKAIGGEHELIPRGLDPYLRERFRQLGKRVVLVPGVIYHHLPPESLGKLWRQCCRNGRQAAYVNRHYPDCVIETPQKHGVLPARVPVTFRLFRFPVRLLCALVTGKPLWLLSELAYAFGFLRESTG